MVHPVYLPDHPGGDHPLVHLGVGELQADHVELGGVPVRMGVELLPVPHGHLGVELGGAVHHLQQPLSADQAPHVRYREARLGNLGRGQPIMEVRARGLRGER